MEARDSSLLGKPSTHELRLQFLNLFFLSRVHTQHSGLPPRITDRHHDVAINPNPVLRVPPPWHCSVAIKFHQNVRRWHSRSLSWAPVKPLVSLHYDSVCLSGKHPHLGLACPVCVMFGFWRGQDTWRVLVGGKQEVLDSGAWVNKESCTW